MSAQYVANGKPLIFTNDLGLPLAEEMVGVPHTNADRLPAVVPTQKQKYLFDNQGLATPSRRLE